VTEGAELPVTLYWQALEPMSRDGLVALRVDQPLAGDRTESTSAELAHPGHGTTPVRRLVPGPHVYVDERMVTVPQLAAVATPPAIVGQVGERPPQGLPVLARLSIGLYDSLAREPWRRSDDAGTETESAFVIGPRKPFVPDGGAEPIARFENGMELYAANDVPAWRRAPAAEPSQAPMGWRGATPILWHATRPVAEDLIAFVHVGPSRQESLQFDGPPATYGRYPTSRWLSGEWLPAWLKYDMPYPHPEDVAVPSSFRMDVGLYRASDGTRVPALRSDGSRWPDDAVTVWNRTFTP
jgi:hypothetical protein